MVAADDNKVNVEDEEVYVWTTLDVDTFAVVHVEVSPSRSKVDALLIPNTVFRRCRGQPAIVVNRGPSYN